jgi:hypothetical protein
MRANSATSGNNLLIGFFSLLLMIVLALMGCGGGSAGTGTGPVVVVKGAVLDQSGAPLRDVNVRVVETGSEDTTSVSGEFQLTAEPESGEVTLELSSAGGVAYVNVAIPEEGGTVSVTLTVNPRLSQVNVDTLEVGAAIVGLCDIYFENRLVIRQANRVPKDLRCVAKVTVAADGRRLAQVPFIVQYQDCSGLTPWVTVAAASTMKKPNRGIGQVEFPFIDDEAHCIYRVVAPAGVAGFPELERRIHTLTYQSKASAPAIRSRP